jgi:hypothetical protein
VGAARLTGGTIEDGAADGGGEAVVVMEREGALLQLLQDSRHDLPRILSDWPDSEPLHRFSIARTYHKRTKAFAPTAAHRRGHVDGLAAEAILPEDWLIADFDIISAYPPPADGTSFASATAECIRVCARMGRMGCATGLVRASGRMGAWRAMGCG